MGVITHTSQDKMSMAGVGARLLKVSLDALGQPAPAGACGRHMLISAHQPRERVGAQVWAGLAEHA